MLAPYLRAFFPLQKNLGLRNLAYSVPNALKRFIIRGKDKIDFMSKNDVVYKIGCLDCDGTYVGQTKRQLRIRIKEHRSDINKKNSSLSVISNHTIDSKKTTK